MADIYNLERFRNAQASGIYERALSEIKSGHKTSHWMWFIFPQMAGLGRTNTARFYSIKSVDEANAYLGDPILSKRLREISKALLELPGTDPKEVLGHPDWLKLCSSMTLFDYVSPGDVFDKVLAKYFAGRRDQKSISIIRNIENKPNGES